MRRLQRARRRDCDDYAELRSGYVDGGLASVDVDRLTAHLAGCPACVAEVAELRRVRSLLLTGRPAHPDRPSAALASRLVAIAGFDADEPLGTRPFRPARAARAAALPSARRRRRRAAAGAVVSVTLVSSVAVAGYLSAPAVAVVPDPGTASQADFSAVLTQLPLGNDALAAAMSLRTDELRSARPAQAAPAPTGPLTLDRAAVLRTLRRAEEADAARSYTGTQEVVAPSGRGSLRAEVDVAFSPERGTVMTVYGVDGTRLARGGDPAPAVERGTEDDDALLGLARRYALTGVEQVPVLGRWTTMIDARTPDGGLAARWWVDDATGLLLRHETYAAGVLETSVGFTDLTLDPVGEPVDPAAGRLGVSQTTATMTVSTAGILAQSGWSCRGEIAGLTLVRLRSDSDQRPGVLHMVYTDGIDTVSVFERKGRLDGPPGGTRWNRRLGAYVAEGFTRSATWASDGTVFTVVTDGPTSLRDAAVDALPDETSVPATTISRIRAGWSRILQLSTG